MTIPDMLGAAEKDVAENGRHGEAIDPGRQADSQFIGMGAQGLTTEHEAAAGKFAHELRASKVDHRNSQATAHFFGAKQGVGGDNAPWRMATKE